MPDLKLLHAFSHPVDCIVRADETANTWLAAVRHEGIYRFALVGTEEPLLRVEIPEGRVHSLEVRGQEVWIVTDRTIAIAPLRSLIAKRGESVDIDRHACEFEHGFETITAAALDRTGGRIAIAGETPSAAQVQVWDSMRETRRFSAELYRRANALSFSSDDGALVAFTWDGEVYVMATESKDDFVATPSRGSYRGMPFHDGRVLPDGSVAIAYESGRYEGGVQVWNPGGDECSLLAPAEPEAMLCVDVDSALGLFACGGVSGRVTVWDVINRWRYSVARPPNDSHDIAFAHPAGEDGQVYGRAVISIGLHPGGGAVLAGTAAGELTTMNWTTRPSSAVLPVVPVPDDE